MNAYKDLREQHEVQAEESESVETSIFDWNIVIAERGWDVDVEIPKRLVFGNSNMHTQTDWNS